MIEDSSAVRYYRTLRTVEVTILTWTGGIEEATAGFNDDFKCSSLEMIYWSQGLFGFVSTLQPLVDVFAPYVDATVSSPTGAATPPMTPTVWDGDLVSNS